MRKFIGAGGKEYTDADLQRFAMDGYEVIIQDSDGEEKERREPKKGEGEPGESKPGQKPEQKPGESKDGKPGEGEPKPGEPKDGEGGTLKPVRKIEITRKPDGTLRRASGKEVTEEQIKKMIENGVTIEFSDEMTSPKPGDKPKSEPGKGGKSEEKIPDGKPLTSDGKPSEETDDSAGSNGEFHRLVSDPKTGKADPEKVKKLVEEIKNMKGLLDHLKQSEITKTDIKYDPTQFEHEVTTSPDKTTFGINPKYVEVYDMPNPALDWKQKLHQLLYFAPKPRFEQTFHKIANYQWGMMGGNRSLSLPSKEIVQAKNLVMKQFVIAIDVSGSIRDEWFASFLNEIQNLLNQSASYFDSKIKAYIITYDTAVHNRWRVTCDNVKSVTKNIKRYDSGGTNSVCVMDDLNHFINNPVAIKEALGDDTDPENIATYKGYMGFAPEFIIFCSDTGESDLEAKDFVLKKSVVPVPKFYFMIPAKAQGRKSVYKNLQNPDKIDNVFVIDYKEKKKTTLK